MNFYLSNLFLDRFKGFGTPFSGFSGWFNFLWGNNIFLNFLIKMMSFNNLFPLALSFRLFNFLILVIYFFNIFGKNSFGYFIIRSLLSISGKRCFYLLTVKILNTRLFLWGYRRFNGWIGWILGWILKTIKNKIFKDQKSSIFLESLNNLIDRLDNNLIDRLDNAYFKIDDSSKIGSSFSLHIDRFSNKDFKVKNSSTISSWLSIWISHRFYKFLTREIILKDNLDIISIILDLCLGILVQSRFHNIELEFKSFFALLIKSILILWSLLFIWSESSFHIPFYSYSSGGLINTFIHFDKKFNKKFFIQQTTGIAALNLDYFSSKKDLSIEDKIIDVDLFPISQISGLNRLNSFQNIPLEKDNYWMRGQKDEFFSKLMSNALENKNTSEIWISIYKFESYLMSRSQSISSLFYEALEEIQKLTQNIYSSRASFLIKITEIKRKVFVSTLNLLKDDAYSPYPEITKLSNLEIFNDILNKINENTPLWEIYMVLEVTWLENILSNLLEKTTFKNQWLSLKTSGLKIDLVYDLFNIFSVTPGRKAELENKNYPLNDNFYDIVERNSGTLVESKFNDLRNRQMLSGPFNTEFGSISKIPWLKNSGALKNVFPINLRPTNGYFVFQNNEERDMLDKDSLKRLFLIKSLDPRDFFFKIKSIKFIEGQEKTYLDEETISFSEKKFNIFSVLVGWYKTKFFDGYQGNNNEIICLIEEVSNQFIEEFGPYSEIIDKLEINENWDIQRSIVSNLEGTFSLGNHMIQAKVIFKGMFVRSLKHLEFKDSSINYYLNWVFSEDESNISIDQIMRRIPSSQKNFPIEAQNLSKLMNLYLCHCVLSLEKEILRSELFNKVGPDKDEDPLKNKIFSRVFIDPSCKEGTNLVNSIDSLYRGLYFHIYLIEILNIRYFSMFSKEAIENIASFYSYPFLTEFLNVDKTRIRRLPWANGKSIGSLTYSRPLRQPLRQKKVSILQTKEETKVERDLDFDFKKVNFEKDFLKLIDRSKKSQKLDQAVFKLIVRMEQEIKNYDPQNLYIDPTIFSIVYQSHWDSDSSNFEINFRYSKGRYTRFYMEPPRIEKEIVASADSLSFLSLNRNFSKELPKVIALVCNIDNEIDPKEISNRVLHKWGLIQKTLEQQKKEGKIARGNSIFDWKPAKKLNGIDWIIFTTCFYSLWSNQDSTEKSYIFANVKSFLEDKKFFNKSLDKLDNYEWRLRRKQTPIFPLSDKFVLQTLDESQNFFSWFGDENQIPDNKNINYLEKDSIDFLINKRNSRTKNAGFNEEMEGNYLVFKSICLNDRIKMPTMTLWAFTDTFNKSSDIIESSLNIPSLKINIISSDRDTFRDYIDRFKNKLPKEVTNPFYVKLDLKLMDGDKINSLLKPLWLNNIVPSFWNPTFWDLISNNDFQGDVYLHKSFFDFLCSIIKKDISIEKEGFNQIENPNIELFPFDGSISNDDKWFHNKSIDPRVWYWYPMIIILPKISNQKNKILKIFVDQNSNNKDPFLRRKIEINCDETEFE